MAISHNVYAEGLTVETIKANLDKQSYLINNGKERISLEHIVSKDGTIDTKVKRSYLPAVTDGKIIDKTRSYKLALNAKKFGKYLSKGAGYATFAQLAIDILGAGVDYVLDPKNNTVQISRGDYVVWGTNYRGTTAQEACDNWLASQYKGFADSVRAGSGSNNGHCHVYGGTYKYNGNIGSNWRRIITDTQVMSDDEFAKEVLKAAATQNNDKAKKVVIDYAKQEILDGDHDDVINDIVNDINSDTNTQPNPTDNTTPNKDTDNNPNSNPQTNPKEKTNPKPKDEGEGGGFELPPFCSWATHVCKFIDWFREDPALGESDKIDIPVQDRNDLAQQDINKQYYDAVGQCPAPAVVNTNFGQIKIPYDTLCSFFSRHSPILIAIAYLIGGYIVIGRR